MLNWCNQFNICCFLDNHNYHLSHNSVECLAAAGSIHKVQAQAGTAIDQFSEFYHQHDDWMFGHLGYDLKNEIEELSSGNADHVELPDLFFFIPQFVIQLGESSISIGSIENNQQKIYNEISSFRIPSSDPVESITSIQTRYTKSFYIETVEKLRQHILRGDCYEINLCQEFYAEEIQLNPLSLYLLLSESSPSPFSGYYKIDDRYLACMSPERYLKKEGDRILSQPMKGTSKRIADNADLDQINIDKLRHSEKERAENIMVVDLVRNDLSRICVEGSVVVDELCEIYTFPQVHQMISTISGILKGGIDLPEAIRATFPMGSMTGAPKKKVMELIDKYEVSKRGLFSGSIGYVTPEKDFDFNVVIRSLLYNKSSKYLSFHTGSAITFNSDPETEYEECLLKAAAIKKALAETNTFH